MSCKKKKKEKRKKKKERDGEILCVIIFKATTCYNNSLGI